MFLGLLDLVASILFYIADTWITGTVAIIITLFLVVKGITTIVQLPIWFGPLSFFAGIVDLVAGMSLYFNSGFTGGLLTAATTLGVFLIMKGGFTVVFGLIAR